ncbi:hypothetical protein C8J56DRAFT_803727 [Mycena floridula]|nr:hypothetical protein C8J56DRAFT_803727 [Mycena floridula]
MGQPARPPTVQQPFPPGGPPFNGNQGNPNANLNPGAANGTSQQLVASQLMNNIMHQLPPPLEKQRFDGTYRTFCESKGSSYPPYVQIDDRPIDLHTLHTLVMQAGGYKKVQANDSMSSIAGRMGFVQFPGGGTEPPKSGPATAQHLTHIYQSYLMEFDNVYIKSVLESKKRQQAVVYANQNINGPIRPSPQQMTLILSLAGFTTQELKAQGVHEKLISFIDSNRNQLQRTLMEQRQFKDTIQHPHSGPGPSPALANSPPTSFPAPQNGFQPPGRINPPPQGPARPNIQVAVAHIHKVKTDILSRHIPNLRPVEIPIDQRLEYNNLIEQLHRGASEIDGKLPMFIAYFKDTDQISKLLTTIVTVQQQRTMLSANNQRFIVGLDTLKIMMNQIQQANDAIIAIAQQRQANPNAAIMPGPPRQPINPNPAPIPPHQQPSPQPGARIPLRPPPPSKKAGTTPNPKTPTPPPSTPVASASTPVMAASPPATPKSPPKTKAPPKKPPVRARRPSTRAAPVVPPTEVASPSNVPVKRPREEDVSVSTPNHAPSPAEVANEPSPPKRIKTEWEGPPTEAIRKQNEAVEKALQSDDEAVAFFDKMSELLRQATNAETQESSNLSADLTETLDQILKGCSAIPDAPDSLLLDSIRESSPPPPMLFSDEFFDFSSYAGSSFDSELPATEDDGSVSKAPTPDLISSSANPSPESEADTSPHAFSYNEVKVEEFPDPLRLGVLKEIDGGEAAYYHSNDWKYDAPMPVPEQPWAIFTSMA